MSACENQSGSCAMRTAFLGSCPWPRSMESLGIHGYESCLWGGAEKNSLSVWFVVPQFLRSAAMGGAGSVVWPDANLLGVREAPGGLREVQSSKKRTLGLVGGQPVLHQAVRLLRRPAVSRFDDQGGRRRPAPGLENGQGVGQAVYARAGAPGGLSGPLGDRHRRNFDPQGAHLPDRRERFAPPAPDLVWRQGSFGSQPGGVLPTAGAQEVSPDPFGRHGYVEGLSDRDCSPRRRCGHPLRQIPHYAAFGRRSGRCAQERICPMHGLQTSFHQGTEIHAFVQPAESDSGGPPRPQGAAASQPAAPCGLSAQGVLRTTLGLRLGGLGSTVLRELEGGAQMAATQTLREIRPHDRRALGWDRGLLPAAEQSVPGFCRGTQYEDSGDSTTSLRFARRGISALKDPELHVAADLDTKSFPLGCSPCIRSRRAVRTVDLSHWFSTRQVCAQEGNVLQRPPTWRYRVLKTALRLRPRRALSSAPGQKQNITPKPCSRKGEKDVLAPGDLENRFTNIDQNKSRSKPAQNHPHVWEKKPNGSSPKLVCNFPEKNSF